MSPLDCSPRSAAALADEAFWRSNEHFFAERMGQPCCTLAGLSLLLAQLPGNFAVVVHGEVDCLNNFPHFDGVSLPQFYCTGISEKEFASGDTARPLRECLEAVIAEKSPEVVFVLSMCLMEMIHDDFPRIAADVAARTGVPVVPLRTSGLKVVSQAEYSDEFYALLAGLFPQAVAPEPGLVNLVGLPRLGPEQNRELEEALRAAGARLNRSFPMDADLPGWRGIGRAAANLIVDIGLYPRLSDYLRRRAARCSEVPLPVGFRQTQRFFRALGEAIGRPRAVEDAVRARAEAAGRAVESFRKRFDGLRLAVGLRMANFSRPAQLAADGTAEIDAFAELGWDVTLLVQGPPDPAGRRHFQERLERLGCGLPALIFAEPDELAGQLGSGRFDAAYLGDHAREYARRAGLALVPVGALRPFFSGVPGNLDLLRRALEAVPVGAAPPR